jgi:hypothetical protein
MRRGCKSFVWSYHSKGYKYSPTRLRDDFGLKLINVKPMIVGYIRVLTDNIGLDWW